MEGKEHGLDPKSNQTEGQESKVNTGKPRKTMYEAFSRNSNRQNATDRIIETYRGVLKSCTPGVTFDDTIQIMVALGCFSGAKTKGECAMLYAQAFGNQTKGGVNEN